MNQEPGAKDTGKARGNAAVVGAVMAELEALGVGECCVCAGARNAALVEAVSHHASRIKPYRFFEERSAAFFALGRALAARRPVAVVTTSGTAVAELLPAVMEAHYQALPLVVVTADRPSRYRGSGAPQAVEQRHIFGDYVVREVHLEWSAGSGLQRTDAGRGGCGPVHFNVCLEEGLGARAEAEPCPVFPSPTRDAVPELPRHEWRAFWDGAGGGVVLASGIHPEDVPPAREFLLKLQAPILAEATSNLLSDEALQPLLLRGGERTLRQLEARRVLRLGAVPSWRWWRELDERDDVAVLNITRAPFRGLARSRSVFTVPWEVLHQAEFSPGSAPFGAACSQPAARRLEDLLITYPHSEPAWMRHLSRTVGAGATVFLGNSLPIREWNLAADLPKPGTRFFANRGANGIDGLVSTWLGTGAEAQDTWLLIGDLSTLYDLSAPWILPQLRKAKRRIVIINNGGGKIFACVPWLKNAGAETQRVMQNPHAVSFEPWARLWGMDYRLISEPGGLGDDDAPCAVWEIRPEASQTEAFWRAWQG